MASTTSTRLWRIHKAAGRPFPQLVEDDVLDYLITEAVYLKVSHEDEKIREKVEADAKRKADKEKWRKESFEKLDGLR